MAIYDRPTRIIIKEMISELAPTHKMIFTKDDALYWFAKNYPKIKAGTISAHLIRFSVNAPSRLHYSPKIDEDMLFQVDSGRFRLFEMESDGPPIHFKSDITSNSENEIIESEEFEVAHLNTFAYESDLKNFLAKNLTIIEPKLRLYKDEGITGIEFPVDGRFIDILALDEENNFVVIELKVSKGHERVIGQILRYMAWIKKNQADKDQKVRGVIVGREISEDLKLACSYNPQISLFEYELSVSLNKIEINHIQ